MSVSVEDVHHPLAGNADMLSLVQRIEHYRRTGQAPISIIFRKYSDIASELGHVVTPSARLHDCHRRRQL